MLALATYNGGATPKQVEDQSDTLTDLSEAQAILVEIEKLFEQGTSGDCSVLPEIEARLEQYDQVLDSVGEAA